MRQASTGLVHLDRDALLAAVARQLGLRGVPGGADWKHNDDPAWLILEEIGRLAQILSGQLDTLPAQLVVAFAHHLGVELEPAVPALALVVATPKLEGDLVARSEADTTVFLAPRTETRAPVHFVPCEERSHLVLGHFTGWFELDEEGRLRVSERPIAGAQVHRPPTQRCEAFDLEQIHYELWSDDPTETLRELQFAATGLRRRRVGWISLATRAEGKRVVLTATVDPAHALSRSRTPGRVVADWGRLEELSWRPDVVRSPRLDASSTAPSPEPALAADGRTLEIRDVGPDEALPTLLQRQAEPAPPQLAQALWRTLEGLSTRLPAAVPSFDRALQPAYAGTWIEGMIQAGTWPPLEAAGSTFISLKPGSPGGVTVRLALAFATLNAENPGVRFFARTGSIVTPVEADTAPLPERWRVSFPAAPDGFHTVLAWDVPMARGVDELLIAVPGKAPAAAYLNAVLALNAPRVPSGLRVPVRDTSGVEIKLRASGIVSPRVMAALRDDVLGGGSVPALEDEGFPIGQLLIDATEVPLTEGVEIDEALGVVRIGARGSKETRQLLLPGRVVTLGWMRRTDGAGGALGAGEIRAFEQLAVERTVLARITQPYPTVGARALESATAASARAVVPDAVVPVLPGELERDLLVALGAGAEGWLARVSSTTSEVLCPSWRWEDLSLPGQNPEATRPARVDPSTLAVAIGPVDRLLGEGELLDARLRLDRWFREIRGRTHALAELKLGTLRAVVLHPARPLRRIPRLPCAALEGLSPADELVDPTGERRSAARTGLLSDALIVAVGAPASQGPWTGAELADWLRAELLETGRAWDLLVWTEEGMASAAPQAWAELPPLRAPSVRARLSPVPAGRPPGPDPLLVALAPREGELSQEVLTQVQPLVDRWARQLHERDGRERRLTLVPLRRLTRSSARAAC